MSPKHKTHGFITVSCLHCTPKVERSGKKYRVHHEAQCRFATPSKEEKTQYLLDKGWWNKGGGWKKVFESGFIQKPGGYSLDYAFAAQQNYETSTVAQDVPCRGGNSVR